MSLCGKEFAAFRAKPLEERKNKLMQSRNLNVTTASHIAEVLKKSSMIAGKLIPLISHSFWYSGKRAERSHACGPKPKKEKAEPDVKRFSRS